MIISASGALQLQPLLQALRSQGDVNLRVDSKDDGQRLRIEIKGAGDDGERLSIKIRQGEDGERIRIKVRHDDDHDRPRGRHDAAKSGERGHHDRAFARVDRDGDGQISRKEFRRLNGGDNDDRRRVEHHRHRLIELTSPAVPAEPPVDPLPPVKNAPPLGGFPKALVANVLDPEAFAKIDTDEDGAIDAAELATALDNTELADIVGGLFTRLDTDGDGYITKAEADTARERILEQLAEQDPRLQVLDRLLAATPFEPEPQPDSGLIGQQELIAAVRDLVATINSLVQAYFGGGDRVAGTTPPVQLPVPVEPASASIVDVLLEAQEESATASDTEVTEETPADGEEAAVGEEELAA